MIWGIFGDTHETDANVIKHVIRELIEVHHVEQFIHTGDIEEQHLDAKLFGGLPVVCAVNPWQTEEVFKTPPPGWKFTFADDRVRDIGGVKCYVGHKFSFEMLATPEASFKAKLQVLRKDHDGLRYAFAGHMHHQALAQTQLVTFINPGAIQTSPHGYEFAVVDTKLGQVIFSRIPNTKYLEEPFTVGIVSDTLNISKLDTDFWKKLAHEFEARGVSEIIHCGNIAVPDIGRKELAGFKKVHYRLRIDQNPPKDQPANWEAIPEDPPIVTINERQFYVHPSLARTILMKSEADMHQECLMIEELHPEVCFILYGNTNDAYFSEEIDGRTIIMNPGDALSSRNFATVCFPRCEITISRVPLDPLPLI
jgi:predicted phosphodiesterase